MSRHIAVLGATGVYGRHLVPRLAAAGHRVRALVRRPEAATIAAACGAARWRDVLGFVSTLAGPSPPQPGGRSLMPSFRVRNDLARETLAWAPLYADHRAGLVR